MKANTKSMLAILRILAFAAMIGYIVQAGSQIISFLVSFNNPDATRNVYGVFLDLKAIHNYNATYYWYTMSFIIGLSVMHAYVWYRVVKLLSTLNLNNPFTRKVARALEEIGIQLFGIWVVSVIADQSIHAMAKHGGIDIGRLHPVHEVLFIAGIVYIISQVFKRGIEIQEENELTV
jgi:hypothetical protein